MLGLWSDLEPLHGDIASYHMEGKKMEKRLSEVLQWAIEGKECTKHYQARIWEKKDLRDQVSFERAMARFEGKEDVFSNLIDLIEHPTD